MKIELWELGQFLMRKKKFYIRIYSVSKSSGEFCGVVQKCDLFPAKFLFLLKIAPNVD
jgi:hypothetical protein